MGIKVEMHKVELPPLPAWTMAEEIGYTPQTTFWNDFSIADIYGADAVQDTFDRAFAEWKNNAVYITELVLVLNHKSWQHAEKRRELSELYADLYYKADKYALDHLKGDDWQYYFETTD